MNNAKKSIFCAEFFSIRFRFLAVNGAERTEHPMFWGLPIYRKFKQWLWFILSYRGLCLFEPHLSPRVAVRYCESDHKCLASLFVEAAVSDVTCLHLASSLATGVAHQYVESPRCIWEFCGSDFLPQAAFIDCGVSFFSSVTPSTCRDKA
jgi:hypothetical protein